MVKSSKWQEHLMETFRDMRKKDKTVKLSDAMKKAKSTYKS